MKTKTAIILLLFSLTACSSSLQAIPATATPTPKPTDPPPTAYQTILFCQDCADAGMEINLWETPGKNNVVGGVPHNTSVIVQDSITRDGVRYYKVRYVNTIGWVSELMIKN